MNEVLNIIKINVDFHVLQTLKENNVISCLQVHTFSLVHSIYHQPFKAIQDIRL
jgi:hypothetical protein